MLNIIQNGYFFINSNRIKTKDNEYIYFCGVFSYGKLIDAKIRNIINDKINYNYLINELINKIQDYNDIRIWYDSNDNEELCNMYFLVNFLNKHNKNIYLLDFELDSADSITDDLLDKTIFLENNIKNNIINKWHKLMLDNNDLRYIKNNDLVSCSFDILDNLILKELNEPIKYSKFIMNIYLKRLLNISNTYFLSARVDYLIRINKIKKSENNDIIYIERMIN